MPKPRLLIVDDEERFRVTLAKILREKELDVDTVGSGGESLEEIRKKLYDVIILDVKMPGMNGIDTLKEIKSFDPGIEVILLTGHASVDSAIDGMRLGAYDYIMKPCEIDALMEEITGAYAIKQSRDERIQKAELRKLISRSPA
jgi:DNA-binding NtrC family response regulator